MIIVLENTFFKLRIEVSFIVICVFPVTLDDWF